MREDDGGLRGSAITRRCGSHRSAADEAVRGLKGGLSDSREAKRRIEEALSRHDRGELLTEAGQTIVYRVKHGGGCHACGSPAGVEVAVRGTRTDRLATFSEEGC